MSAFLTGRFSRIACVTILLCLVQFAPGNPAEPDEIPGTTLMLPQGAGISVHWVLPTDLSRPRHVPESIRFDVDAKGQPWFGTDGTNLTNPLRGYFFRTDVPFQDFAWVQRGEMILCTESALGSLASPDRYESDKTGVPVMRFRPALQLPERTWRLFPGSQDVLYLVGSDRWGRDGEIYVFTAKHGKGRIEKLFASEKAVASVAGDGEVTYVAMGRVIVKLDSNRRISGVFSHPKEEITGIVFSPDSGLFYATPTGIGYVGDSGRYEFMNTPDPAIRLRGDSLYIFLGQTYGVIRLDGVSRFKTLGSASAARPAAQPAAQPAVEKKSVSPARVEKPLSPVEDEIFCPKCRMVNDPGTKVCTNCGAKLKP